MKYFSHPSVDEIIVLHRLIKRYSKVKVNGFIHSEFSSRKKLQKIINQAHSKKGLYKKAAVYLLGIRRIHVFEDGNKRLAYIVTKSFIRRNNGVFAPNYLPEKEIKQGVKDSNMYSIKEIANWIKRGVFK